MVRILLSCSLIFMCTGVATLHARTLRVPKDFQSIQSAIDSAEATDVVLVEQGTYHERIVLKPGVILRSAGDDTLGKLGLARVEATIVDGALPANHRNVDMAGITMAEDAVLDGFTIIGVGIYDDKKWQQHHETQGNDQSHEHIGALGTPGISIVGIDCEVRNNIVHHIGYTGIAIQGTEQRRCSPLIEGNICYRNMGGGIGSMHKSTAVIRKNICFENFYAGIGNDDASPLIVENKCYENIRAGIGISEESCPVVRGNQCYRNRRSGIGSRTLATTRPVIEDNDCYENEMAGIGAEENSAPVISKNRCYRNRLAGIGIRSHAMATIVGNECYENGTVGIGHESDSITTLIGNHCHDNLEAGIGFSECREGRSSLIENRVIDNAKVAIGVREGWHVTALRNELSREGGMPPIVMIFSGSQAYFLDNTVRGSGVAGIRVAGELNAVGNTIVCSQPRGGGPPNNGIWALPGSRVSSRNNQFVGWRQDLATPKE
ncbi:hypothetical protein Pla52n_28690 [Stieleria varia]|uniref:Right handed beta helix domain-containing protein n=3 Tax=Stieleria varia TaxID=2528005 RepID=A0A5C6AXT4_9BACT|nr:hypothetical protein Pla52n_28690 [Stieleria varia]